MKNDNEKMFKKAALLYVQQMGDELIKENDEETHDLDLHNTIWRNMRKRLFYKKIRKTVFIAAPAAACLLVAMFIYLSPGSNLENQMVLSTETPALSMPIPEADIVPITDMVPMTTTAPQAWGSAMMAGEYDFYSVQPEIAFLSARLPEGYSMTYTDYDHGKTIYHVTSIRENEIIIMAEHSSESLAAQVNEDFIHTLINNTDVYIQVKHEYNIVMFYSDGLMITLSSPFEADDLLEVAAVLV